MHSEAAAYYNLGYLLNKKGQTQAAMQHFVLALRADPSMIAAQQWIEYLQKKTTQARVPHTDGGRSANHQRRARRLARRRRRRSSAIRRPTTFDGVGADARARQMVDAAQRADAASFAADLVARVGIGRPGVARHFVRSVGTIGAAVGPIAAAKHKLRRPPSAERQLTTVGHKRSRGRECTLFLAQISIPHTPCAEFGTRRVPDTV